MYEDDDLCGSALRRDSGGENNHSSDQASEVPEDRSDSKPKNSSAQTVPDDGEPNILTAQTGPDDGEPNIPTAQTVPDDGELNNPSAQTVPDDGELNNPSAQTGPDDGEPNIPTAQTGPDDGELNNLSAQTVPDDFSLGYAFAKHCDTDKKQGQVVTGVATDTDPDPPESIVTIDTNSEFLSSLIEVVRNFGKWLFIAVGVLVGIMLLFQVVPYISTISSIEQPALRWVCIGITVALFAALLAMIILLYKKVFYSYLSSSLNGPVKIPVLKQIAERQKWQQCCSKNNKNSKLAEIQEQLSAYIKDYDIDNKKTLMPEELYKKLEKHYNDLKNDLEFPDAEWINNFMTKFQKTLDEAAANIVMKYALRTGVSTALSPKALADRILVIIMSLAMIKDLLLLYKVKPRFGETIILFGFTLVNVYVGGKAQWLTNQAVEGFKESAGFASLKELWHTIRPGNSGDGPENDGSDVLADNLGELFVLNGVSVFSFIQKPVKMMTEGLVNFWLIKRLGLTLIGSLQPTTPLKDK